MLCILLWLVFHLYEHSISKADDRYMCEHIIDVVENKAQIQSVIGAHILITGSDFTHGMEVYFNVLH